MFQSLNLGLANVAEKNFEKKLLLAKKYGFSYIEAGAQEVMENGVENVRALLQKHGMQISSANLPFHPTQLDDDAFAAAMEALPAQAAALSADCKYGFRLADDVLTVTLITTAGTPDLYPERGIHAINLYVLIEKPCPFRLKTQAQALTRNMIAVPTGAHEGKLATNMKLIDVKTASSIVSAIQIAKDGALTVRVFETCGKDDEITVNPGMPVKKAVLTDLDENVLGECCKKGSEVSFKVPAYTIAQVKIYR